MTTLSLSYRGYRVPPEIISHAVWLYHRFLAWLIQLFGIRPQRQLGATKGVTRVAEVKVRERESIESALRRFKREVQQQNIIKDIKKHSFYLKPGDKRRAKQALARKRLRKKQMEETK